MHHSLLHRAIWYYPVHKLIHPLRSFSFQGEKLSYFIHRYNATWKNERAVEIPIVWNEVEKAYEKQLAVLEIGNVLSHYFKISHRVIDKYEEADQVENIDVTEIPKTKKYDLIIAISTLEHVGWDEKQKDSKKIEKAIHHLLSLLNTNGKLIITGAFGQNPHFDSLFLSDQQKCKKTFLKRISYWNSWKEVNQSVIEDAKYGHPFWNGNGLVIAIFKK